MFCLVSVWFVMCCLYRVCFVLFVACGLRLRCSLLVVRWLNLVACRWLCAVCRALRVVWCGLCSMYWLGFVACWDVLVLFVYCA